MIDHIFINGCSFNQINPKGNVKTFAGEIIAKHFDKEFTNLSRGGRGNYRICATTKMWYEKNKNKSFAIIEWTSPFRRDYTTNDGWKPIKGFNTTWLVVLSSFVVFVYCALFFQHLIFFSLLICQT